MTLVHSKIICSGNESKVRFVVSHVCIHVSVEFLNITELTNLALTLLNYCLIIGFGEVSIFIQFKTGI